MPPRLQLWPRDSIRVVDWNIDRGLRLAQVVEFLKSCKADIILLQEVDLNARRTRHLDVSRELARSLQMNYVFAREFQELTQGSHTSPAFHGQATLSIWPLSNARILRFQKQSNFWRPRWFLPEVTPFQERLGGRLALAVHANVNGRTIAAYNLHLESKGDDDLRCAQLSEVLGDAQQYGGNTPVLVAGDLNIDASRGPAATACSQARFQNVFGDRHMPTRPARSFLDHGRSIDWIFTRGSLLASQPQIHPSIAASDHYPLSVTLSFA